MNGILLRSPREQCTLLLGYTLGRLLEPGDILALRGELGAGKTLFVRGLAQGLGIPPQTRVTSPTFTIINEYCGRLRLFHLDLYRIGGPEELETLPWEESLFGSGVAAIEWPERIDPLLPTERIEIEIRITGDESREILINAHGESSLARMSKWREPIERLMSEPPCRGDAEKK